jgi:hypothetical protein
MKHSRLIIETYEDIQKLKIRIKNPNEEREGLMEKIDGLKKQLMVIRFFLSQYDLTKTDNGPETTDPGLVIESTASSNESGFEPIEPNAIPNDNGNGDHNGENA